ncbi:cupin domain-containing protein [Novosphingobium sp. 9U]|uniref:cupin domain-containing protein n=1 Tax=Novosphingobium sp. 9U TaxID=2653158 RepID=UPI0012F3D460|nr:cupin domain-containing protein [Novosphingobium sp. 9U]VWX53126.1 Cupin domain-containing protein [Novosphingobium sp. 9U]
MAQQPNTSGCRRIVAGLDAEGRSAIVADGFVAALGLGNMQITQLWSGALGAKADSHAPLENTTAPFRFEQMADPAYSMMVAEYGPGLGRDDPGIHFTDTADHFYVIEGDVVLVLQTGEVVLRAGDVGVVRGVVHGWRNDTEATARVITFVLPATPAVAS